MSDSTATLFAYLCSLALMLGYRLQIEVLRRRSRKSVAEGQFSNQVAPKNTVICELKPNSKVKIS